MKGKKTLSRVSSIFFAVMLLCVSLFGHTFSAVIAEETGAEYVEPAGNVVVNGSFEDLDGEGPELASAGWEDWSCGEFTDGMFITRELDGGTMQREAIVDAVPGKKYILRAKVQLLQQESKDDATGLKFKFNAKDEAKQFEHEKFILTLDDSSFSGVGSWIEIEQEVALQTVEECVWNLNEGNDGSTKFIPQEYKFGFWAHDGQYAIDNISLVPVEDVVNGEFKDGLVGWTIPDEGTGTVVTKTAEGLGDDAAMHVSVDNYNAQAVESVEFPVEKNTEYMVSFYKKGTGSFDFQVGDFTTVTVKSSTYWEQEKYYFNSGDLTSAVLKFDMTSGNTSFDIDRVCVLKLGQDDIVGVDRYLGWNSFWDKNSDMEEVNSDNKPVGWGETSNKTLVGVGEGVNGSNALKLVGSNGYDCQRGCGEDRVIEYQGKTVRVSFDMKLVQKGNTEDVINVSIFDQANTIKAASISDSEWTTIVKYIDISETNTNNTVFFSVLDTHSVLIDNLKVQEVLPEGTIATAPPVPATEAPIEATDVPNGDFSNGLSGWTVPGEDKQTKVTLNDTGLGDNASVNLYAETSLYDALESGKFLLKPQTDYMLSFYKKGTGSFRVEVLNDSNLIAFSTVRYSTFWEQEKVYFNSGDFETAAVKFITNAACDMDIDRVCLLEVPNDDVVNVDRDLSYNLYKDKNPDMEELNDKGQPIGWGTGDVILDGTGKGYNGTNGCVISETTNYECRNDFNNVKDYKGKTLRISFKAKFITKGSSTDAITLNKYTDFLTITSDAISDDVWTDIVLYSDLPNSDTGYDGAFYFQAREGHVIVIDEMRVQVVDGSSLIPPATPEPTPAPVHPADEDNLIINPDFKIGIDADDNIDNDDNDITKGWEFNKYAKNVENLTDNEVGRYPEDYPDAERAGKPVSRETYKNASIDTTGVGIAKIPGPALDWDKSMHQYLDTDTVVPGRYKLTVTFKGRAQIFFKREEWSQDFYSCTGAYINEGEGELQDHLVGHHGVENVTLDSSDVDGWKTVAFWVDIPNYEYHRENIYGVYDHLPVTSRFRVVITNYMRSSLDENGMAVIHKDEDIPKEFQVEKVSLERIHKTYHVDYVNQNNKIVADKDYVKGEPIGKLPTVYRDGYNFLGWELDGEMVSPDFCIEEDDDTKHVELKAKYEYVGNKYRVNVPDNMKIISVNGSPYREEMGNEFEIDTKIVMAMKDNTQKVDYWKIKGIACSGADEDGWVNHPGYARNTQQFRFLMPPTNDFEIKPVILAEGAESQREAALAGASVITAVSKAFDHTTDPDYARFYVYGVFVKENINMKDAGIIMLETTEDLDNPDFQFGDAGVTKIKSTSNNHNNYLGDMGEYIIVKKGTKKKYWVRSYVSCKVDKVDEYGIAVVDSYGTTQQEEVFIYSEPYLIDMSKQ